MRLLHPSQFNNDASRLGRGLTLGTQEATRVQVPRVAERSVSVNAWIEKRQT